MNDQPISYVDGYVPPATTTPVPVNPDPNQHTQPTMPPVVTPVAEVTEPAIAQPTADADLIDVMYESSPDDGPNLTTSTSTPAEPLPDSAPTPTLVSADLPVVSSTQTDYQAEPAMSAAPAASQPATSEELADQNIFEMLGIQDGSEEERERFLDELQQVIWEDFIENDVELLITEQELTQLRSIMADATVSAAEQQEKVIVFLEQLIPDLEEIMLEKALELKEDMMRERLAGMREFYANQPAQLQSISAAEELMSKGQWRSASQALNAITS